MRSYRSIIRKGESQLRLVVGDKGGDGGGKEFLMGLKIFYIEMFGQVIRRDIMYQLEIGIFEIKI